jgi:hypothetical protein
MSRYLVRVSKTKVVEVESPFDAGAAVRAEIEALGWIGAREWTLKVAGHRDGAVVYEATEERGRVVQKPVAIVSYNGRVWALDGTEISAQ